MTLGHGRGQAPVTGAWATVLGVTLALAGCAASAETVPGPDPLLALLDVAWSEPTSDVALMEQLVAECMADAGFTYVPSAAGTGGAPSGDEPPEDAPSEEAPSAGGRAFGYGITSGPRPGPPAADPNAAAVAALSPARQAAYWAALDGATPTADESGTGETGAGGDAAWQYDWQRAGCRGKAQHDVYGDPAQLEDAAALRAELAETRLAAASDPRVAELDAAWSACMAGAGHPDLLTADAAEASVREAWDALWAVAWAGLPADPSATDVAAARATADDAVRELAAREAAVAGADRACRDQVGYDVARDAVTAEYQQRFYQAHRTALAEWLTATGAVDG